MILPRRRNLRLLDYDYSQSGAYFVTICTEKRFCHLGQIVSGSVHLSPAGKVALSVWDSLPERFPGVSLDARVVMPNHVHGTLVVPDAPGPALGSIVRAYKGASTRLIRKGGMQEFGWQANYYEHVIRGERDLERVREYIVNNPLQWHLDRENPEALLP